VKTNLLFFTKGGKTECIWYYDLSWVKVGKKTPLTLAHFGFGKDGAVLGDDDLPAALLGEWKADTANIGQPFPSYARLLPERCGSRYSWIVDFSASRAKAREKMQPLLAKAAHLKAAVVDMKENLKRLKKGKAAATEIVAKEMVIREQEKTIREIEAEADAIDAAVFDLKAVNPNAMATADERTPLQIIASLEEQGHIVAQALRRLNVLLTAESGQSFS
jgi:type I restriction enzyme M protein